MSGLSRSKDDEQLAVVEVLQQKLQDKESVGLLVIAVKELGYDLEAMVSGYHMELFNFNKHIDQVLENIEEYYDGDFESTENDLSSSSLWLFWLSREMLKELTFVKQEGVLTEMVAKLDREKIETFFDFIERVIPSIDRKKSSYQELRRISEKLHELLDNSF